MSSMSSSKRTQKELVARMNYLEKLAIAPKLLLTLANDFSGLFTTLFRGKESKPPKFFQYLMYTHFRTLARLLTPAQLQVISPCTDDVYAAKCKEYKVQPDSVILEDGTRAHWIGPSAAEKVIVNCHGGGYCLPAFPHFMEFMFLLQAALSTPSKPIAILFLSYDLAPSATYPRQLQQAAALMSHVLYVLHKEPQNIILMGDSAGANLALALMSHISHPHPSKDTPILPITLAAPLRAVVLISPWVDFRVTMDSFKRNEFKDCIDKSGGALWADTFMGHSRPYPNIDNYNQAIQAPSSWWEGLMVEEVLVVAGKDEVLVDGIEEFVGLLKQVESLKGKVTMLISEGEGHDQPSMDLGMGYKTERDQARTVRRFLGARL